MGRIIRWLFIFLRIVTPWVIKFVLFVGKLIIAAVLAFWTGVPVAVDRIVKEWMQRAWDAHVQTEYGDLLHWIFTIVAYGMIFFGWIGLAYLTVFLADRLI
jgi:hypothetical protein